MLYKLSYKNKVNNQIVTMYFPKYSYKAVRQIAELLKLDGNKNVDLSSHNEEVNMYKFLNSDFTKM